MGKLVNDEGVMIREALEKDAEELIEYLETIGGESDFLTFGLGEFGATVQQEVEFIKGALKKNNAVLIVAEIDGQIVGNLNFSGGPRARNSHVGEFGVSVLKEYWGNGIGEKLIKYLIQWSKASGIIKKINLRARTDNAAGIHLYKKLGFIEEGILTRDSCINNKFYDSLLMGLLIE